MTKVTKKETLDLDSSRILFPRQGIEPGASHVLGECSIFELYSQSTLYLEL